MKKHIHIYIIYLALFSFIVTGVSLSRYSKTLAGSETVKAASPVIACEPVSMTLNGDPVGIEGGLSVGELIPGDVLVYRFDITNDSGTARNQVLMKYRVSIAFSPADPANIPLTCALIPDGVYPPAGDNWTYMGFSGEETHSYTLTITWDEAMDDPANMNQQQEVLIQIDAEQADSA